MKPVRLPTIRTMAEGLSLQTVKLEKILADSQSRVASYLDVRYPDEQDMIFLLGGKPVRAGRFTAEGREILTVTEAMDRLRTQKEGTLGFCEISKVLMIVVMGTFIFEPTHGRLKTKLINFNSLVSLFARKRFTGYMELQLNHGLNYLTFFNGQVREGYFVDPVPETAGVSPVEVAARLLESARENGEINLYESGGEEGLHEDTERAGGPLEPPAGDMDAEDKAHFTAEILDLCLAAIYEDLFRLMSNACLKQMETAAIDTMFSTALEQVSARYPTLFRNARERENGQALTGGLINFERVLKAKNQLPLDQRDQEFMAAMHALAAVILRTMKKALAPAVFQQGVKDLTAKIAMSRKAYQGNFTIIKFLYEFSRLLEKIRTE